MPPKAAFNAAKSSSVASVPSYAELLSSSRAKAKAGSGKVKKSAADTPAPATTVPYADPGVAATASRVTVGCRVVLSSSGLFGTVRFTGNTTFQSGLWVGVELDNQEGGHKPQVVRGMLSRGKNDGMVKGQRYFTCPENHGIFVRPTSFDIISYPGDGVEMPAEPSGAMRSGAMRVKSAVSDSDESSTDAFKPGTYASSVASNSVLSQSQNDATQPAPAQSSSRRSSHDVYGALYGNPSAADSEPPSPDRQRSSTSSPRTYEPTPPSSSQQVRRLSPRRRTSALVSSIDDVLASMEYAASDMNRPKEKKDSSAFKSVPQRKDSKGGGAAAARPKSPFERRTIDKSSVYSSEEERLFVENLVELVAKSPSVSEYLKTEIEKHHHQALSEGAGEGASSRAEVADLAQRVHELETAVSPPDATPQDASLASRFERQTASADRTIASLAARVEALESTLAPPLKALTEKLTDLEKAIANHSPLGPLDSSDLRNTLNVVKALAMQAHGALHAAE